MHVLSFDNIGTKNANIYSCNTCIKKSWLWKTWNVFSDLVSKNILSKKKVDFGKPGMFFRILVSINILSKKKLTLENLECFSGFDFKKFIGCIKKNKQCMYWVSTTLAPKTQTFIHVTHASKKVDFGKPGMFFRI